MNLGRIAYFQYENDSYYGQLVDDETVAVLEGNVFEQARELNQRLQMSQIRLLPPCNPQKFIHLWNNSKSAIKKLGRATPKEVLFFIKPNSALSTGENAIIYPHGKSSLVVLEGELGIVIGKTCKDVLTNDAKNYIFGYTIINDVTAKDIVSEDPTFPQYTRAKGFDSFGIMGPVIATSVDPMELTIRSYINGRCCQDYSTADLVFNPFEIVAHLSRTMTLLPGDVIACGTSLGADEIKPGDIVEVSIEGIGTLRNAVQ